MPTIMTHGVAAAALATVFPNRLVPPRVVFAGVVCSIVPDLDVLGILFRAHPLLGHRGITHSLLFATAVASLASAILFAGAPLSGSRVRAWIYLMLASASHGLLDAMTDRHGLGIPFFWPFDSTRYFFPFAPIAMSPIGTDFFSARGLATLASELKWVWLPSVAFAVAAVLCRRVFARRKVVQSHRT